MGYGYDVKKIAVTTDLSENSLGALAYANNIAEGCDAKIYLIHVLTDIGTTIGYIPSIPLSKIEDEMRKNVAKQLKNIELRSFSKDLDVETVILKGNPASEVAEFAEKNDIDLIIVSTTGKGALEKLLIGSVAESIVKRSTKSVLVVKPISK